MCPPSFARLAVVTRAHASLRLGKGTQCTLLVEKFNFSHLSAGDLLRAEQDRQGSQFGDLIRRCIREGEIVPMEVTVKLLENAMRVVLQSKTGEGWGNGRGRFLIDGFPRKMDQALKYEEDVGVILSNLHRPPCSSTRLLTVWWCDIIIFFRCAPRHWCCFSPRTRTRCCSVCRNAVRQVVEMTITWRPSGSASASFNSSR